MKEEKEAGVGGTQKFGFGRGKNISWSKNAKGCRICQGKRKRREGEGRSSSEGNGEREGRHTNGAEAVNLKFLKPFRKVEAKGRVVAVARGGGQSSQLKNNQNQSRRVTRDRERAGMVVGGELGLRESRIKRQQVGGCGGITTTISSDDGIRHWL